MSYEIATPPATGVWYDLDETFAAVVHRLRLQGGDVDGAAIRSIIPAAAYRIDVHVDREVVLDGPPPAPQFQHALEELSVQRYQRNQPAAALGLLPIYDDETALLDRLLPGERERWAVS